ncbi:MAG: hypothetical protein HKN73_15555 [Gemmatimonadetes bacterium]|nr:hypothetical protein [Gemmatimonadota bacterium]
MVIRRPLEDVFDYMNDVSKESEWQPQLREAEQTPPGPVEVGTRRRYVSEFMGKRVENVYVITTYEENSRVVCETTKDAVMSATSDIRWEAVEDGTKVTMALEGKPSGALRFLPTSILEATFQKEVRGALSRLKTILEEVA